MKHIKHRQIVFVQKSPPVRGAWIETAKRMIEKAKENCRPPCGGRGLKLHR